MNEQKKEYCYIPLVPEQSKKIRNTSVWIVLLSVFAIILFVSGIVGAIGAIELISYLADSANTLNLEDNILLLSTYSILSVALVFFFGIVLFASLLKLQLGMAKDLKYIRNYLKNKG